jgi:hypothetical protein
MKIINNIETVAVSGGDDWYRYSDPEPTLSETRAQLLADCVGGASGHDGASAFSS